MVDPQLSTLMDISVRQHYRAERGQHGEGSNKTGRSGEDLEIAVPPGTVARDADSGEELGELLERGERLVVAKGGRGGRGNARFATATHQTPRRWEPGEEGEERRVELELKLIADVGLVGEPNAGKSTLLSSISAATPKIADYPFTTLTPNLGVVSLPEFRSFVVADIPGIIEGAHEGKGLGLRFADDLQAEYDLLREELLRYSETLAATPHCMVLTKADLLGPDAPPPSVDAPESWGTFIISSVTREGLAPLLEGLWERTREARLEESAPEDPEEEWWVPEV
jgi:GTP-binding protein